MTGIGRHQLRRAEFYGVAVAVLFVAGLAVSGILVGADDVLARLGLLSPELVAGLLALSLVNYASRTWRWHLFGRRLGIAVPFPRTALYYVAGFAMTPTPGKLGEALRLWLLERVHGYRYAHSAAAVLAIAALLARSGPLLSLIGRTHAAFGRWPRMFAAARHAVRQTARLFDPALVAAALALGLVGWLAECVGLYWLVNALGGQIGLQGAVFVFAFSLLVGAVSMLPGGLGSTEATMFALLTLADVPADIALAATAVNRAATLWFAVLLGAGVLPAALRLARGPAMATKQAGGPA